MAGEAIETYPAKTIDLLFILLNRALLYYQHTINWAHGRRDYPGPENELVSTETNQNFTQHWPSGNIKICHDFFKNIKTDNGESESEAKEKFSALLLQSLKEISEDD